MFTVESIVDQNTKNVKIFTGLITNVKYRDQVNKLIDTQAEFTKNWYDAVVSLNKTLVETSTIVK